MKKQLACFLAGVMTITALPMNALAAPTSPGLSTGRPATVRLTRPVVHAQNGARFVEWGSPITRAFPAAQIGNHGNHWAEANDLAIVFDEGVIATGRQMQFTVELENAEWFFRNATDSPGISVPANEWGVATGNAATFDTTRGSWDPATQTYTRYADPFAVATDSDGEIYGTGIAADPTDPDFWEWMLDNDWIVWTGPGTTGAGAIPVADRPIEIANLFDAASTGAFAWAQVDTSGLFSRSPGKVLYTLQVSRGNRRLATVTMAEGVHLGTNDLNPGQDTIHFNTPTLDISGDDLVETPAVEHPIATLPSEDTSEDTTTGEITAPHTDISTGDIQVPTPRTDEAVETFGKKQEQAPEGETVPAPTQDLPKPAKTAEAVLVDAMDDYEYYELQAERAAKKAGIAHHSVAGRNPNFIPFSVANAETAITDALSALDAVQADLDASPVTITPADVFSDYSPHIPGFDATTHSFNSVNPAVSIVAELVEELGQDADFGTFSINAPGNGAAAASLHDRVQFAINQLRLALISHNEALATRVQSDALTLPDSTPSVRGTLAAVRAAFLNLQALLAGPTIAKDGIYIDANAGITIPLVVQAQGSNNDHTVRVTQSTPIPVESKTLLFARTGGGTTTTVRSVATGRDRIALNEIMVRENRPNIFQENVPTSPVPLPDWSTPVGINGVHWQFELVAPAGYRFTNLEQATVTGEGSIASLSSTWGNGQTEPNGIVRAVPDTDNRVVAVGWTNLDRHNSGLTGALIIQGLELLSNNPDVVRERELDLSIRNLHTRSLVTNQTIPVANARDFGVTVALQPANAEIPTIINGRLESVSDGDVREEHAAARFRVTEAIRNSLWNERDLVITLPQQVRVRKMRINGQSNFGSNPFIGSAQWFYNDRGRSPLNVRPGESQNNENVRISDNVITIRNINRSGATDPGWLDFDLYLNVEAGFTGEIEATVGGSAFSSGIEPQTVVIAEAINPVEINANLQNVRMGYTFVPVGDFTITENVAGALQLNEELYVSVTDEFFSEIHFGSNFRAEVTDGDLQIRNVRSSNNLGTFGNWNNNLNWRMGTNAIIEIDRESTKPSTITFSNVTLRLSPVSPLPQGQHTYSIVAWGPAVAQNFEGLRDTTNPRINPNEFFNTPGISQAFVQAGGAGTAGFTNIVTVSVNSPIVTMNGEQMLMDTSAYISPESESLMVPVRFVSMALGLEPGRVLWNEQTRTVTIDAGERFVQFTAGANTMLINGVEIPMLNALSQPVTAEIRDDRMFIPFRALADSLNVYVAWNAATSTATFDPNRASDRNFHLEDLLANGTPVAGYRSGVYTDQAPTAAITTGAATIANRVAGPVKTAS